MATDPMFQLEHSVEDQEKSTDEMPRLQQLQVCLIQLVISYL